MPTIVMMGNPGAGKSTLLSSLVKGSASFPSGISLGRGKTQELQEVEYNGDTYIDTPGLSDAKLREKAATAIMKSFKRSGKYKLFFVVTLESGRVKPDDVTTIKLVLDAISHIKSNQYSIIINKLSDGLVSTLNKSEESREELAACLSPPSIGAGTRSIYYVPMKFEWIDQDNKWGELPELLSFMEHAPEVFISSDNIRNIQYSQFEEIVAQLREEIRLLREENEVLRQTMANREKELGKLIWNGPQNTATDTESAVSTRERMFSDPPTPLSLRSLLSSLQPSTFSLTATRYSAILIGDSGKWESSLSPYINVPGLSNVLTKAAAKEIVLALKRGGIFKVFFFVSLEHGAIKPNHLATIKLVLQAAPQIKAQYSIITNTSKEDALNFEKGENWISLRVGHGVGVYPNDTICLPVDPNDTDKQKLQDFIRKAPEVPITSNRVGLIDHKSFAKEVAKLKRNAHGSFIGKLASVFRK